MSMAQEYGYRHPRDMIYLDAETFEAPRRKRLDFDWIDENSSDKEWARSGSNTIAAATKKAKAEGWKPVWSQYWGDNAATRKSRMRREAKVWNLMSKSPQWKPWLKFLTERDADNEMSETMDIFRGKAYWKAKNRNSVSILGATQDYGPWIYDEDRIYVPDHFSEDGGWQVLVKGNQALLLYYIADYDGPVSTPLMRKTFNLSPVKATKTAKKAKPIMSGKGQQYVMKGTGRGVKKAAKPKAKAKAKTGRKAPTISATKRKIGTRMRGNDGKMWEVKKSGKSQRWMAGAEGMDSEQDGYTFAYSQGHNDGRKNIGYNQQISSGQEQKHFRKILSQRAESFDPADAWDNHIHQEELALEAYEEYLEEVSEQDEPLSFEDWYEQTMAIYDTPEYDEYLEKQYLQIQENAEELERQLKTLEGSGDICTVCGDTAVHFYKDGEVILCDKHYQQQYGKYSAEEASPVKGVLVAPAIAAIVGFLGGLRAAGFKFKRN